MALPVRNLDIVCTCNQRSAVVVGHVHLRIGCIDILAIGEYSLEGEILDRSRSLESEFHADVALVHAAH